MCSNAISHLADDVSEDGFPRFVHLVCVQLGAETLTQTVLNHRPEQLTTNTQIRPDQLSFLSSAEREMEWVIGCLLRMTRAVVCLRTAPQDKTMSAQKMDECIIRCLLRYDNSFCDVSHVMQYCFKMAKGISSFYSFVNFLPQCGVKYKWGLRKIRYFPPLRR